MATRSSIDAAAAGRRRTARVLAACVAASLALHAALLLTLPGWIRAEVHVGPLEVTLEKVEPPQPIAMAPREPPRAPPREPARIEKRPLPKPRRVEQPVVRPRPQVLALPKEASAPRPAFTIAPPEPRALPEPPAPRESPGEVARAAPKGDTAPAEKITPPVFTAAYLRNPQPVYPLSARRRGEQGTVLLKVLVTREGAAAAVDVEKTSGHAALDQAALEAVRKWRFAPARRGAEPIASSVLVPIVFRLEGVS
jgi:protein TonB